MTTGVLDPASKKRRKENERAVAKQVANFTEIVSYLTGSGVEESEAIHIAEGFMDSQKIQFDADGNFDPISIDFNPSSKSIART